MAEGMTRRDALVAAGAVGAVGAGAVGVAGVLGAFTSEAPPDTALVAAYVPDVLPQDDPGSAMWSEAAETVVPLVPQRLAPPYLEYAGAPLADENARWIETRIDGRAPPAGAREPGQGLPGRADLEADGGQEQEAPPEGSQGPEEGEQSSGDHGRPDPGDPDGVRRYHDAVAVMLPTAPGDPPPITMGEPGKPVHILQWRATWQRDLAGKSGVDQIYPRVVHDVMPDDVLPPETAELYWVGRAAGNPLSQVERTTPIEQMVAEGFGTTTHLPQVTAQGRGVHDDSSWSVTIGFPTARDAIGAELEPAQQWFVAFAVWLGDQENRGGRKHYATWIPFSLELP